MKVKMKKEAPIVTSLIPTLLIVLSLSVGNAEAQLMPPNLQWTNPTDGEQDVDPVGVYLDGITLQFDMLVTLEKVRVAVTSDDQSFEGQTEVDDKSSQVRFILEKPLPYEAEIVVTWYARVLMGGEGQGTFMFTTMSDVPPFVVSITPEPGISVSEETLREDGVTILFNEPIKNLYVGVTADDHVFKGWKARISEDGYFAWLTAGELSYDNHVVLKWEDPLGQTQKATVEVSWDTVIVFELFIKDFDMNEYVLGQEWHNLKKLDLETGEECHVVSEAIAWYSREITHCSAILTIPSTGQSDPDCIDIDYLDVDTVSLTVGESELLQPKTKCVIEVHLTDILGNNGYFAICLEIPEEDDD